MNFEDLYVIRDGLKCRREDVELPKFGVYEVMRLHFRGPLFFEEHLERLNQSLLLQDKGIQLSEEELRSHIYALIEANGNLDANITIYVTGDEGLYSTYVYYSRTVSTLASAYQEGVRLKTRHFEREHPSAKNFTSSMKALREELLSDDCYDYVLVDGESRVRECSRSNLFFFKGTTVYTAGDDKVLSGITRKKVIALLKSMGSIVYRDITVDEMAAMDGAFLSGTSPGIVPIVKIDNVCYDMTKNSLAGDLMSAYAELVEDYYDSLGFFDDFRYRLFQRQLPLTGPEGYAKLASTKVMVVGLGGVGGSAAESLVRSGIGELILVDSDRVEYSNINRQVFATYDTIGELKVEAAAKRLRAINPSLRIVQAELRLTEDNTALLAEYRPDYIVDAIDSFGAKIALITWAKEEGLPIISSCGMASKLDPTKLSLADIYETAICPLAKKMRRALRDQGVHGLDVVYSTEEGCIVKTEEGALASISFVPPQAGLLMASRVVRNLIQGAKNLDARR